MDQVQERIGIIYRITNIINGVEYHGLSINTLKMRKSEHKHGAKLCAEGYSNGCRRLYHAMNHYGFKNFRFEVLENVPESKLKERETFWILERNSLHPNGYNLTTGGEHHRHHIETKQRISDKCKVTELSKGLPMYVVHRKRGEIHYFRVNEHPLCMHKEFGTAEYGSIEAAREACLKFFRELEAKGEKYVPIANKGDPTLRRGISKLKNGGYRIGKTHNGLLYEKVFRNKSKTDEQLRQDANEYLDKLLVQFDTDDKVNAEATAVAEAGEINVTIDT